MQLAGDTECLRPFGVPGRFSAWNESDIEMSPPGCSTYKSSSSTSSSPRQSVSDERMIDTRTTESDMQFGRLPYNGGMVVPPMTPNAFYQDSMMGREAPRMPYSSSVAPRIHVDYLAQHQSQSPPKPGMKDVPTWLKGLRLHKYTLMFQEFDYDEMMRLDEEKLERRQVTKGARRKILQSVEKLRNRSQTIRDIIKGLSPQCQTEYGCLRCGIVNLRQLMATPIRAYVPVSEEAPDRVEGNAYIHLINDDNLPALLLRMCIHINAMVFPVRSGDELEDEYLLMMFTIFDRMANNEAFTDSQKRRVLQMKKQARRYVSPQELRRHHVGVPHAGMCDNCANKNSPFASHNAQYPWLYQYYHQQQGRMLPHQLFKQLQDLTFQQTMQLQRAADLNMLARQMNWNHPSSMLVQQQIIAQMQQQQAQINCMSRPQVPVAPQPRYERGWVSPSSCSQEARRCFDATVRAPQMIQAAPFSQLPQYQSPRTTESPLLPRQTTQRTESPLVANENRSPSQCWPSALYSSKHNEPTETIRLSSDDSEGDSYTSLWSSLPSAPREDSTSGYSSSESERGSGAASPSRGSQKMKIVLDVDVDFNINTVLAGIGNMDLRPHGF